VTPQPTPPEPAEVLEERNRKLGALLIGVMLLLVVVAIIGAVTHH
jgi:hypothetical protein